MKIQAEMGGLSSYQSTFKKLGEIGGRKIYDSWYLSFIKTLRMCSYDRYLYGCFINTRLGYLSINTMSVSSFVSLQVH